MNLQCEHAQGGQQGTGSREAQVNHVSQQLLFHSLTEKWTQNLLGFSGFRVFFVVVVFFFFWTTDAGLKHVPFLSPSPHFKGFQLLFQPQQQQESFWDRKNLPSLPQRFHLSMPSRNGSELYQSTYRKSQHSSSSHTAEFISLLEQVGRVYVRVWVATGAWHRSPAHWPLQMTLVSLSLKILVSTVILQV